MSAREQEEWFAGVQNDPILHTCIARLKTLLASNNIQTILDEPPLSFELVIDEAVEREHPVAIGRYTVLGLLGQGGSGIVYRAWQPETSREVAVKLLDRDGVHTRGKFTAEISVLASLNHPAVSRVFEGGIDPGSGLPFIAMELVQSAKPITRYCQDNSLNVKDRIKLILQVCEGIAYAHARGVVHRDIKPANILIAKDGRPVLVDFGIARSITSAHTTRAFSLGTFAYVSPEQLRGRVTTACDVYGLGVVLYELLENCLPIDVTNIDIAEAARRIEEVPPRVMQCEMEGFNEGLRAIIHKSIEKAPSHRYATIPQLSDDLLGWLEGRAISVRPDTPVRALYRAIMLHRRRFIAAASLVIVCGVLLGTWSYTAYRNRERQHTAALKMTTAALAATDFAFSRMGGRPVRELMVTTYIPVTQELVQAQPDNDDACFLLARLYEIKGDLLWESSDTTELELYREKSLVLLKTLTERNPDSVTYAHQYAIARIRLGDCYNQSGRSILAKQLYHEVHSVLIDLSKRLAADQNISELKETILDDLGWSYHRLAGLHKAAGDDAEALEYYSEHVRVANKLNKLSPDSTRTRWAVLYSHVAMMFQQSVYLHSDSFMEHADIALLTAREMLTQDPQDRRVAALYVHSCMICVYFEIYHKRLDNVPPLIAEAQSWVNKLISSGHNPQDSAEPIADLKAMKEAYADAVGSSHK